MEKEYYIRTQGFKGDGLIWWRPESAGYTTNLDKAGKYSEYEAIEICKGSGTELAYECGKVDSAKKGIMRVAHSDFFPRSDADIDFRPRRKKKHHNKRIT